MNLSVTALLHKMSARHGICIREQSGRIHTYQEIVSRAEKNRGLLNSAGCTRNPCGQYVIAIDVSLAWRAVPVLLAAMLEQAAVVFIDTQKSPMQAKKIVADIQPHLVLDDTNVGLDGLLRSSSLPAISATPNGILQNIAFILYTSGTTGFPKGVMLTQRNIWSNVEDILDYFHIRSDDRILIVRPFTNASALTGELLPALYCGAEIVIKDHSAGPLQALRLIGEHAVTLLCTTPTIANQFARQASRYDVTSIQTLVLSGECVHGVHARNIHAAFTQAGLWNAYGLTEASPRVSCMTAEREQFLKDFQCVGRPLRHIEARIICDDGRPALAGEEGILHVKGPNIMKGYYNDSEASAMKLNEGWLRTSDRAFMRDGSLYILGRGDALIVRAGVNIDPMEVEAALLELEGITEAFVFGQTDGGRTSVHAWIVAPGFVSEQAVTRFITKSIPDTRLWPDMIRIKNSLPKTGSGKLLRQAD